MAETVSDRERRKRAERRLVEYDRGAGGERGQPHDIDRIREIIRDTEFKKDNGTWWTLYKSNNTHVHDVLRALKTHSSFCSHCRRSIAAGHRPLTATGDEFGSDAEQDSEYGDEVDY
jgi:hypothetical protein